MTDVSPTIPVQIDREIYTRLKAFCEARNITIKEAVNELIKKALRRHESMSVFFPDMKIAGISKTHVHIADMRRKILANIGNKDNLMYCDADESSNCDHIYFLMLCPEFYENSNAEKIGYIFREPMARRKKEVSVLGEH